MRTKTHWFNNWNWIEVTYGTKRHSIKVIMLLSNQLTGSSCYIIKFNSLHWRWAFWQISFCSVAIRIPWAQHDLNAVFGIWVSSMLRTYLSNEMEWNAGAAKPTTNIILFCRIESANCCHFDRFNKKTSSVHSYRSMKIVHSPSTHATSSVVFLHHNFDKIILSDMEIKIVKYVPYFHFHDNRID